MAVLDIARMGAQVLRAPAHPVPDPTAPEIAQLVEDMKDTMIAAGGIGIAAPQVRVPLRVAIFEVPSSRTEDGQGTPLTVLINPDWHPLSDDKEEGYEGCLSVPGMTGLVPRFTHIAYRGYGLDGKLIERQAEGYHARVVQHELDHLAGILYPQRMADLTTLAYTEELRREIDTPAEALVAD
ncbi:MAG TPA: peptide deformylase [Magnetospirillaceae bacterium]|jgi:peptide deformylase